MQYRTLYCPVCQTHTKHADLAAIYATACTICGTHTSQLERLHSDQYEFTAPDGSKAKVVHNTPKEVTFYIDEGKYKGYMHYNKQRNTWIEG